MWNTGKDCQKRDEFFNSTEWWKEYPSFLDYLSGFLPKGKCELDNLKVTILQIFESESIMTNRAFPST